MTLQPDPSPSHAVDYSASVLPAPPSDPVRKKVEEGERGAHLHALVAELLPIRSSITGEGLRRTLRAVDAMLGGDLALDWTEVPTGTPLLDWTAPPEWRVGEAWIKDASGARVVDGADHPLHVVGYSEGVDAMLALDQLRPHLHTLPERPGWIPYRTRYWAPGWGFCLRHETLRAMERGDHPGPYRVRIDAERFEGHLTYAEVAIPGESEQEILLSAHACHPGLANDNASSLAVATALARHIAARGRRRYTYRFLFAPGTVGAIAWLARNRARLGRIAGGLVLANLGDPGPTVYKRSRPGTLGPPTRFDRAVRYALAQGDRPWEERPFTPLGYDERQFGSPGFDLPVGRLSHTPWGEYPQYHTSADSLGLVTPEALADALDTLERIVDVLEMDEAYLSTQPFGEPQLGRRGLYDGVGGKAEAGDLKRALLWTLNLADGAHSLLDIAERADLPLHTVRAAADALLRADLLRPTTT